MVTRISGGSVSFCIFASLTAAYVWEKYEPDRCSTLGYVPSSDHFIFLNNLISNLLQFVLAFIDLSFKDNFTDIKGSNIFDYCLIMFSSRYDILNQVDIHSTFYIYFIQNVK
jgi:hypothetical protein